MKIQFFCLLLGIVALSSCGDTPKSEEKMAVNLICEERPSTVDYIEKTYAVYFVFEDSKVKLGDVTACDQVIRENWADIGIPPNAIVAAGGWYAGGGDYFYVVEKGKGYQVLQLSVDEAVNTQPLVKEIYATKEAR